MAKNKRKSIREQLYAELNERFCKVIHVNFCTTDRGIVSVGSQKAINRNDQGVPTEVNATCWFDHFLFFICINFYENKPFVSVSFFEEKNGSVQQLFRAEWDNYHPQEDYNHPQPHWHFTIPLNLRYATNAIPNGSEENIYCTLEDDDNIYRFLEEQTETDNIYSQLEDSKITSNDFNNTNIARMHFAMAGNWIYDTNMLCKIDDEKQLVDWLISLFNHVRKELEYIGQNK